MTDNPKDNVPNSPEPNPAPNLEQDANSAADASGQRKLMLIFAIALVPMAMAWYMFFTGSSLIPSGRTHKGQLIEKPYLSFDELRLVNPNGSAVKAADSEQWQMLVFGEGLCGDTCRQSLYLIRQVNAALGKEAGRVGRYYIDLNADSNAEAAPEFSEFLRNQHPRLKRAKGEGHSIRPQLQQATQGGTPVVDHWIFVTDPRGNIMMYYRPDNTGNDMIKDLKRLLKVSKIG